jgi:DNA-binding MarR family transcriptional regulator
MEQNHHISQDIGIIFRKTQSFLKIIAKEHNLTFVDVVLLIKICNEPGIIQEQLATSLVFDSATVTRSLKELEKKEIIIRKVTQQNQREKKVFPLEKGLRYINTIYETMAYWDLLILEDFSSKDIELLENYLAKLKQKTIDIDIPSEVINFHLNRR